MILALIRRLEKGNLFDFCGRFGIISALMLVIPVYLSSFILNMPLILVYRFGIYGMTFFLGYFVFAHDEVIEKISGYNIPLILLSATFAGTYIYLHFGDNYAEIPTYNSVFAILYAWSACLAILGCTYIWYNRRTKLSAFMTKRSFGLYVFHYLPLSVSAYYLKNYTILPPFLIYLTVFVCSFSGGLILGEVIPKIPFVRWAVLGIKKEELKG